MDDDYVRPDALNGGDDRELRAKPLPGIPPDVACPWCGGYVRGHQWIGTENCSIMSVWDS